MEEENEKKQNSFAKIISDIYVSIKEKSLNASELFFFSTVFELTNKILIIDIIFNYKRTFQNIYFFLYFISPTFYFEVLNNNKFMLKNNANRLNDYTKDQVNLLANKYFKVDIYEQKDFYNYRFFGIIYLIVLLLLLLMNLIKKDNCIINIIKKIGSYLFYITFCTFSHLFLLIYNRGVFIQFSDSYYEIDYTFIYDVALFLLYNILHYLFYNIFIYAYGQNETYYFLTSKIFIATFSLNELGIFLFVIRLHIKYSILFQLIWSVIYIYEYIVIIQVYRDSLHQSTFQKISFFFSNFCFLNFYCKICYFISY